jgi:hypothetical protein
LTPRRLSHRRFTVTLRACRKDNREGADFQLILGDFAPDNAEGTVISLGIDESVLGDRIEAGERFKCKRSGAPPGIVGTLRRKDRLRR